MLFLLLKFLYIITLSYIYGNLIVYLTKKYIPDSTLKEFAIVCFTGLAFLTGIVSWFSIFTNIGLLSNTLILGGAIVIITSLSQTFKTDIKRIVYEIQKYTWYYKLLFGLGVVFTVYFSSYPSITLDEGTYHAQFIRWSQQYGTIFGLGNIEQRMGFNSHWHLLTSLFNWSYITTLQSNHINGALYILTLAFCFSGFRQPQPLGVVWFFKTGMLVFCSLPHILVYYIIAPSADLLLICYTFVIFVLALADAQKNKTFTFSQNTVLITILAVFLFTTKLSAAVICLLIFLPMLYLLWKKQYKNIAIYIGINLFFLLPWIIRNIIFTGYIIYPLSIDLFNFDWEVPVNYITEVTNHIKECAFKLYTPNAIDTAGMSFFQKYYTWFVFNIRIYDKLIIAVSFIVLMLSVVKLKKRYTWLYIWLWIGLLFWLIQAPDPRFGYGALGCALLFGCYFFIKSWIPSFSRFIISAAIIIMFCFQGTTLLLYNHLYQQQVQSGVLLENSHNDLILTPSPYLPTIENPQTFQNQTIYIQYICWANAFPCISDTSNIQFRGEKIEDGFQQKPQ